jgi:hypothetical protein
MIALVAASFSTDSEIGRIEFKAGQPDNLLDWMKAALWQMIT